MIRLAIFCTDQRLEKRILSTVSTFNCSPDALEMVEVECYRSGQALVDNVSDGDQYDAFLIEANDSPENALALSWAIRERLPKAILLLLVSKATMGLLQEVPKLQVLRCVNKKEMASLLPEALQAAVEETRRKRPFVLSVTHYHDVTYVPYEQILYIHRVMRVTEIVLAGKQSLRDRRSLGEVFHVLNDPRFFYIERGCVVNLDYVTQVAEGEVLLKTGKVLSVSQAQQPAVKAAFAQLAEDMRPG